MLTQTPRHAIQILRREDSPDEQMSPQHRTRRYYEEQTSCHKHCQECKMREQQIFSPLSPETKKHYVRCRGPEDWTSPVADECQDSDGEDIVAWYSVVGTWEVDGRDGVGAAEGKERGILEEKSGCCQFDKAEV